MLSGCQGNPLLVSPAELPERLVYVGCADGRIDGRWTDADAMRCTMDERILERASEINFKDGVIKLIEKSAQE
jgi:ribosomal protein S3AE